MYKKYTIKLRVG